MNLFSVEFLLQIFIAFIASSQDTKAEISQSLKHQHTLEHNHNQNSSGNQAKQYNDWRHSNIDPVLYKTTEYIINDSKTQVHTNSRPIYILHIGLVTSTMKILHRVWSQTKLSISTQLFIYSTWVLPILLYSSETRWLEKTGLLSYAVWMKHLAH